MGHIITLILDLLTHWTVPSWFSWHDCTQQREKCGMCKWFALVLSIETSIHLTICVSTCLVIQLHSVHWIGAGTCNALMCIHLIYSLYLSPGFSAHVSVCIKRTYVYACAIWPLSVLSSCPCSMLHDGCVEPGWSGVQQLFGGLVCFFRGRHMWVWLAKLFRGHTRMNPHQVSGKTGIAVTKAQDVYHVLRVKS